MLRLATSEDAAEHIHACHHHVSLADNAPASAIDDETSSVMDAVAEAASLMLGVEQHDVEFLLANASLPALARLGTDAEFKALLDATEGLVDPGLLEGAIRWLHKDAVGTP